VRRPLRAPLRHRRRSGTGSRDPPPVGHPAGAAAGLATAQGPGFRQLVDRHPTAGSGPYVDQSGSPRSRVTVDSGPHRDRSHLVEDRRWLMRCVKRPIKGYGAELQQLLPSARRAASVTGDHGRLISTRAPATGASATVPKRQPLVPGHAITLTRLSKRKWMGSCECRRWRTGGPTRYGQVLARHASHVNPDGRGIIANARR
jgi:hypothetical protein